MFIRGALKSTDPGASNGGSNFEIRPLEADLASFEVARLPKKSRCGMINVLSGGQPVLRLFLDFVVTFCSEPYEARGDVAHLS